SGLSENRVQKTDPNRPQTDPFSTSVELQIAHLHASSLHPFHRGCRPRANPYFYQTTFPASIGIRRARGCAELAKESDWIDHLERPSQLPKTFAHRGVARHQRQQVLVARDEGIRIGGDGQIDVRFVRAISTVIESV